MTESNEEQKETTEELSSQVNTTKIDDGVITTIAGIAASKVDGVVAMDDSTFVNLAEKVGRKDLAKGIKVESDHENKEASIDVTIDVKYGTKIHEVARKVQSEVREATNNMTGYNVPSVTVNIQGIQIEDPSNEVEERD